METFRFYRNHPLQVDLCITWYESCIQFYNLKEIKYCMFVVCQAAEACIWILPKRSRKQKGLDLPDWRDLCTPKIHFVRILPVLCWIQFSIHVMHDAIVIAAIHVNHILEISEI
jgi:hypothetical protein